MKVLTFSCTHKLKIYEEQTHDLRHFDVLPNVSKVILDRNLDLQKNREQHKL